MIIEFLVGTAVGAILYVQNKRINKQAQVINDQAAALDLLYDLTRSLSGSQEANKNLHMGWAHAIKAQVGINDAVGSAVAELYSFHGIDVFKDERIKDKVKLAVVKDNNVINFPSSNDNE